jgi:adenylate cyclase
VVDSPGDNLLAEFGSVVDAVECAVKIQGDLEKENDQFPKSRRMEFRIGVNLGDVVEDGERIYGDGINIAARLESLADPGGICISRTTFDQIESKLPLGYEFLGEQIFKNIAKPIGAYRVTGRGEKKIERASVEKMAYPLPDKPSIAILSFTNMSGDPTQEHIGDGISENITSALSKVGGMFVIARNSTFVYKGRPVKVQQVAEDLGVRYVLEGSVQKSGDRLRITAQLIDAINGYHLWSEKYDRKMKDLFDLQDEITKKIAVSLQVELTHGEAARLYARSTDNLEAWSYMAKGIKVFLKFTGKEDNAKARTLFEEAIKLDPGYVDAWVGLAATYDLDARELSKESRAASLKRANELVQKALAQDDKNAWAHQTQGNIYRTQGQLEKATTEFKMAISLEPNFSTAYALLGANMYWMGEFDEAIVLIKKAMRLSPYYSPWYLSRLGAVYQFAGNYEEAIATYNQLLDRCRKGECPTWWALSGLARVNAELGRVEEARIFLAEALESNPRLSLEYYKRSLPFKDTAHVKRFLDALTKAGLPEKTGQPVQDKPSIAVLPFINMSNDPEQEYFSDGMSEELIGTLAKLEGLKVISRTSAFYFKGKDVDLRTIGEKLKVDNVLEGSIRKAGNQLRISAQLIKVADDTHLWSETYDRELKDVFAIQDEISRAVVQNLKVKLLDMKTEPLVKNYTKNTEAYELFLKGRFFISKGFSGFGKAIEYYEKTIKAEPEFAKAYSNLAAVYIVYALVFSRPSKEMYLKAKSLALKALEIDEMDSDAYGTMGYIKALSEYDWPGAERDHKRAIELNPGNIMVHFRYTLYLIGIGRVYEAIGKMKQVLELDPFSVYFHSVLCATFYFARQFDKAIAQSQKTLELSHNEPLALAILALSHAAKGMYDKGLTMLQQVRDHPLITTFLGYIYGKAGKKEEAQQILEDLLNKAKQNYFSPYMIAVVYSSLGDKDKVFNWLEIAFEERDTNNWCIKVDPMFDDVHSDPRWTKLMGKMGLAD